MYMTLSTFLRSHISSIELSCLFLAIEHFFLISYVFVKHVFIIHMQISLVFGNLYFANLVEKNKTKQGEIHTDM